MFQPSAPTGSTSGQEPVVEAVDPVCIHGTGVCNWINRLNRLNRLNHLNHLNYLTLHGYIQLSSETAKDDKIVSTFAA